MSQTDMDSFVDEYVDTTTDEVNGLFDGIMHSYVQYSRKKDFFVTDHAEVTVIDFR